MIEIKLNDAAVMSAFNNLLASANDLTPAMRQIAGIMADAVEDAFANERDPVTGAPWAQLRPVTVMQRGGNAHPILQRSGQLAASVSQDYGNDFAQVGTNKIYASTQQFGANRGQFGKTKRGAPIPWGNIPARPFLGIGEHDKVSILDVIHIHLAKAATS